MSFRTVLLHLDNGPHALATADLAISLARKFEAQLTGVATVGLPEPTPRAGWGTLDEASLGADGARAQATAEMLATRLKEKASAAGLASCETVVATGEVVEEISDRSRVTDLVIISQADPDQPGARDAASHVERIVLHSAAPVLVVPYAGGFPALGGHALVAWHNDRSAARAVQSALPLLHDERSVTLIHCARPGEETRTASAEAELAPVLNWLKRHRIEAGVATEVTTMGIGETLLSRASDVGADLIVMGAWNHSRLAEAVLGGVTRTMLQSMTVPVLMAH